MALMLCSGELWKFVEVDEVFMGTPEISYS
jgi:hypothetical protein